MKNKAISGFAFAAVIILTATSPALAGKKKDGRGFASMDADGDGAVTKVEFTEWMTVKGKTDQVVIDEKFAMIDADSDGSFTKEEAKAAWKGKHGREGKRCKKGELGEGEASAEAGTQ